MTRRSTKTPTNVGRLKAARADGASIRKAAAKAKVPRSTAHRWLSKAKAKPQAKVVDAATLAELAGAVEGPVPLGLPGLVARAEVIRGLLARVQSAVERDEFPMASYVQASRYLDEIDQRIHELTPPAPRDPNEDESVIAAERTFLERITGLIEAAERRRTS